MSTNDIALFIAVLYGVPLLWLCWPYLRRLAVGIARTLGGGYVKHSAYIGTKAWTGLLLAVGLAPRPEIMVGCKSTSEAGPTTLPEATPPTPLKLVPHNNSSWLGLYGEQTDGIPGPTPPENVA